MTYVPWWRHLLGIPTAIAVLVVWLVLQPDNPWPPVVLVCVFIAGYAVLAGASYRRSRAQRHHQPNQR
jgi:hypothetical protein